MFTGIIDHYGTITKVEPIMRGGLRLWIKTTFNDFVEGESISVDGICLTVTHFGQHTFCCDLSPETLRLTTAQSFKLDQPVNLERALQPTSRMGGHFVTGHVDQTCRLQQRHQQGDFIEMHFSDLSPAAMKFIIKKGSVTLNGVSLTVNDKNTQEQSFSVMLIPHTLERTNLAFLREGDTVNIEFDMIARIIVEQYQNMI